MVGAKLAISPGDRALDVAERRVHPFERCHAGCLSGRPGTDRPMAAGDGLARGDPRQADPDDSQRQGRALPARQGQSPVPRSGTEQAMGLGLYLRGHLGWFRLCRLCHRRLCPPHRQPPAPETIVMPGSPPAPLHSAGHSAWPVNRQCANIRTGAVAGGRSPSHFPLSVTFFAPSPRSTIFPDEPQQRSPTTQSSTESEPTRSNLLLSSSIAPRLICQAALHPFEY